MIALQGFHDLVQQIVLRAEPPGQDWGDIVLIAATVALAVGTIVLVKVTAYYARQTRSLVGQTERLADHTSSLAASTQQSVTQASLRQQLENSMFMWVRINEKYDPIVEIGRSRGWPEDGSGLIEVDWGMLRSLFNEIDFFAYFVVEDVIKDETALSYFRFRLSDYIKVIMKHYASANTRHDLRNEFHYFNRLIMKWDINIPDDEAN
jgi:hypothetical protein